MIELRKGSTSPSHWTRGNDAVIAARGSSDSAAMYREYLIAQNVSRQCSDATPSLSTVPLPVNLIGALVIIAFRLLRERHRQPLAYRARRYHHQLVRVSWRQ